MIKKITSDYGVKIAIVALYLIFVIVSKITGLSCVWFSLTGIRCPGCGYTHAVLAALKLDFVTAFNLNPMFWSFPILVLLFLFNGNIFKSKTVNNIIIFSVLFGFIILGIYRLLTAI